MPSLNELANGVKQYRIENRLQDVLGMDPNIERRMLLPDYSPDDGFIAPEWVYEAAKAMMLPGHAMQGGYYDEGDVLNMAGAISGPGAIRGSMTRQDPNLLGMNVYHGGPHKWGPEPDFPHGRPRLDKMGTGEGAQAYGHGFYSAEAKGVAKDYQDVLGSNSLEFPDGRSFRNFTNGDTDNVRPVLEEYSKKFGYDDAVADTALTSIDDQGSIEGALAYLRYERETIASKLRGYGYTKPEIDYHEQHYDDGIAFLNRMKDAGFKESEGTLYKLDLPDEDVAKYLDWDAPLSEQPEALAALNSSIPRKIINKVNQGYDDFSGRAPKEYRVGVGQAKRWDGQQVYNALKSEMTAQEASEALRKAGIPGLKYYDGMSRNAGEGTRNYVTWDQDVLDRATMLERNGVSLQDLVNK